jgi:hypothetical protein
VHIKKAEKSEGKQDGSKYNSGLSPSKIGTVPNYFYTHQGYVKNRV